RALRRALRAALLGLVRVRRRRVERRLRLRDHRGDDLARGANVVHERDRLARPQRRLLDVAVERGGGHERAVARDLDLSAADRVERADRLAGPGLAAVLPLADD